MNENKKYFIGLSDIPGEYILYYLMNDKMIYLSKYNNPEDAVNALNKYNLIGTSDKIGLELFNQISLFVEKDIQEHDFIMSLFVTFKYADTIGFQNLIQILNISDKINNFRDQLNDLVRWNPPCNKELLMYISLYDLIASVSITLNMRTLYDPISKVVTNLIKQIMNIFDYNPTENIQ
jgi:hypothetical protein